MLSEKRIKNIIRETIDKLISNKDCINEITIGQKYDIESKSNKTKLPFELFSKLCQLDPTTKTDKVGKYANWILAKYQPNVDLQALKIALEWYADGIKRNILQREGISPDINTYKSYEEFISVINNKMHSDSAQLSNTEVNHREKLKGQFEIIGSTSKFEIIKPLTFAAERYFGSDTEWCTVANESYFSSYMKKSPLYIVYPKDGNNDYKMQFHERTLSFADKNDNVYETISECIFSLFDEDNIQANELRNLCKKIFNPDSVGLTTEEKIESLKGMSEIPNNYFKYSEIKEIIIPNNITSIGDQAFCKCSSLTSITIPDSVTSIGDYAFSGCNSLTSVTIPNSVTSIGDYAFSGCNSLTSVTIPDSVTEIGEYAFEACTSLTSITIPNSVTYIGRDAFYDCTSLTSVTIGNSVTSIGEYAFKGCTSLTSVTIPNSVTSIGYKAFYSCTSLTSVTIPNSVTEIGYKAFDGCTSMEEVIMPIRFRDNINDIFVETDANIRFYGQQNESLNKDKIGRVKYRLTENGLRKIIGESIKKILQEMNNKRHF